MSQGFEIVPLFATPIVLSDLPDAPALCAELRKVIEQREKTHPGTQHSNLGGWQSTWDMDRWGGAPAIKLLALARNLANRVTTDREGKPVAITWRANMWANVNRSGHGNEFHSHPGSYWSAVFYVDDAGIDADASLGGELEFMDPRGPGPAMYAPHLGFAMPGGLSAGANETVRPKAGRLVMFPAWILHQVRPYRGNVERISIAMNLSL
ncbi:MAG: TIGR02466 family protein [Reyranella sp.]|uniref:TIGR02466 family protein n=1 Tax=Reyranella sp. TaxID=1929291 RepID=UPI00272FA874|nr:TIGR02466 family protein [Reyranella sp.]MDP1967272.1 TIGR02466 family protein [Reyranella sp.]MDP2373956.1 TIGR02466 family protein [Reyranella sp.]